MMQSYKVFVEEKLLLITEQENYHTSRDSIERVLEHPDSAAMWEIYLALKEGTLNSACFICKDLTKGLHDFKSMFTLAEAAGGLVKDDSGRYLFIFRNDRWDLPKGKLELNEGIKTGAKREVREECGLKHLKITRPIITTYHTYERKGKDYFKPTYWFLMTIPDVQEGIAQVDEGITELKWAESQELGEISKLSYATIQEVIDSGLNHPTP